MRHVTLIPFSLELEPILSKHDLQECTNHHALPFFYKKDKSAVNTDKEHCTGPNLVVERITES